MAAQQNQKSTDALMNKWFEPDNTGLAALLQDIDERSALVSQAPGFELNNELQNKILGVEHDAIELAEQSKDGEIPAAEYKKIIGEGRTVLRWLSEGFRAFVRSAPRHFQNLAAQCGKDAPETFAKHRDAIAAGNKLFEGVALSDEATLQELVDAYVDFSKLFSDIKAEVEAEKVAAARRRNSAAADALLARRKVKA